MRVPACEQMGLDILLTEKITRLKQTLSKKEECDCGAELDVNISKFFKKIKFCGGYIGGSTPIHHDRCGPVLGGPTCDILVLDLRSVDLYQDAH
jgi:hypothetical protein